MAPPPLSMLLRMRRVEMFAQEERARAEQHVQEARLKYVEETSQPEDDEVDRVRHAECLKALERVFGAIPHFPLGHRPHKDLIVEYAMVMTTHGGIANYVELQKMLLTLLRHHWCSIPNGAISSSCAPPRCGSCHSRDLITITAEAVCVCQNCGHHIESIRSHEPEKLDNEERQGRTHHGDVLVHHLTEHGRTQGGMLDGSLARAQKRVDEQYGENYQLTSMNTIDTHIRAAEDQLKNALPRFVGALFESNKVMMHTALNLFASKRKTMMCLHNFDKWLAAAVVLSIIVHLETRRASSTARNKALRAKVERSHERLVTRVAPVQLRVAELDERGVRRFLKGISQADIDRVVRYLHAMRNEAPTQRAYGALLSSLSSKRLQAGTGLHMKTANRIIQRVRQNHRQHKSCAEEERGRKRCKRHHEQLLAVRKEAAERAALK